MSFTKEFVSIRSLPIETSDDRLNTHFTILEELKNRAIYLTHLSHAFAMTGSDKVSDNLFEISQILLSISSKLSELQGAESTDRLKDAQKNVGGTFSALLSRAEKEDKK